MKKKYSIYCSGGASRVRKFFSKNSLSDFPVEFLLYDGNSEDTIKALKLLFGEKLIVYSGKNISNKLLNLLNLNNVDYLFCFGNQILKGNLLNKYQNRIINFHPSLLPAFPGLRSIDRALESNVQILGNTAHFIDEGIDTGPIIMQSVIARASFTEYEDVLSLQLFMLEKIWYLLDEDKIKMLNGKVTIENEVNFNKFYSII